MMKTLNTLTTQQIAALRLLARPRLSAARFDSWRPSEIGIPSYRLRKLWELGFVERVPISTGINILFGDISYFRYKLTEAGQAVVSQHSANGE